MSSYTLKEAADMLRVSASTVAAWIGNGELLAENVSRNKHSGKPRWLISEGALLAFRRGRSNRPSAPTPARTRKPATVRGDVMEFFK
jgi:excisionase family DNA binding protein